MQLEPKRRWRRRLVGGVLGVFLVVNVLAFVHAGAMMQWAEGTARTDQPEELGLAEKLRVLAAGVAIPRPENSVTPAHLGLDFETLRFPNGQGEELEAWYLPGSLEDNLVLLFHGYCAQKQTLLSVAQGFVHLGHSVLMVDFYGSGGSSGTGTTVGMREAFDVAAAVELARERWPARRIVLYGQSMGGAAILRAVARLGVRPDALVVESTFDRFLSTVASRFHRMGLPATPLAQLLVFWGGVRLGRNPFEHNPVEYAREVSCPTLVLQGANDPNVSADQAGSIEEALGGWKRLVLVPKTGHVDVRTADTRRWTAAIRELLEAP